MFKRLSKARALQEELGDQVDESEPVTLETALDEESASDSEDGSEEDSESDQDEEDDAENQDSEADEDVDSENGHFTVQQALQSPIYLDTETPVRAQIFRCVACPIVTLKNEKSIEVHSDSKRRYARFIKFAESEMEREGERVLSLDPRVLVDLLEDERKAEEKAAEEKPEPRKKTHVPRVERRKQRRAVRNEKRAALQEAYAKRTASEAPPSSEPHAKRKK